MFIELSWSDFILTILNGPQSNLRYISRVENSGSFMNAIVELANQKGGKVIIGFDKNNYQLLGVRFEKSWLKAVVEKELTPKLQFTFKQVIRNRKIIYIIEIPEGDAKPYQSSLQQSIPELKPLLPEEQRPVKKESVKPQPDVLITHKETCDTLSAREKKCLAFLNENYDISNTQYRDLNGVSHKTAHNELANLVKTGFLRQVGQGRTTKYCLNSEKMMTKETNKDTDNDDDIDSIINTKIVMPAFQAPSPSLFGDDLNEVISRSNPSVSITDLRKASQCVHMNSHFNENNDINFAVSSDKTDENDAFPTEQFDPLVEFSIENNAGVLLEDQAIDEEIIEDFCEEAKPETLTGQKNEGVFEQLDDGDDLLKQLAELYEQIKS